MTKKKLTPRYNDNKSIRARIDKLLEKNASNVANSCTGSKLDIGDDTMDRQDLNRLEWLKHAQEEAMDLAVYLEKLIQLEEQKPFRYEWNITNEGDK
jgi:hypothetical protein